MNKRNATVFVVDDDESLRRSLDWLIGSIGLKVRTFPSARAFLKAYRPDSPGCLVLDVRMPEMNGLELMEQLCQSRISVPIIFLSAHGDVPMVVRAMQSGAVDFLQKPFNSQQFLDRVNTALKRDLEAREKRDSRRQLAQGLAMLTPREREILELVLCGESSKCIASALDISPKTVEAHRAHITKKLNVRSFNEIMGKIFGKMISDALHAIQ